MSPWLWDHLEKSSVRERVNKFIYFAGQQNGKQLQASQSTTCYLVFNIKKIGSIFYQAIL
jgi:hypothetical protein